MWKGAGMGLAERRKVVGYSQEGLAHALGVDRTTVGRWESGKTMPQPPLRPQLAEALQVDLAELDALVVQSQPRPRSPQGRLPAAAEAGGASTT
ncbi:helix-turn-helix transcriptional regulator [Streptomyces sp. 7N604]|uniref:helix-turn-helix transcriptional regulator n=1 Tax=Streptomyces sp. 7N604 TaxID=3457415 RepID=UPI003FD61FCF